MQQNAATGVATLTADDVDQRTRLKALFSSGVGGVVEWYDYFLYGTMAAIVFGPLFFPRATRRWAWPCRWRRSRWPSSCAPSAA